MAARLRGEEIHQFTEALAILLKADIPLDYALESLGGLMESPRLRGLCAELVQRVREGAGLSFALSRSGAGFDDAFVGMVRVGEMSGNLPAVLEHLAAMLARNQELKRNLASAVFYPAVLLGFSLLAVGFILVYVLPSFVQVFQDMNLSLPPAAAALVWIGRAVERYGLVLSLLLAAGAALAAVALRSPGNRLALARALLRAGPVGRLVADWQAVVFCRSLGLMLASGVPINQACGYAAAAVGNPAFRRGLAGLDSGLKEGSSLVTALGACPYFPRTALRLVALGEQTGSLATMLQRAAELLESRVKFTLGRLLVVTEPAIILLMGLLVGFVVVTMLTTIFTLTQGGL